MRQGRAVVAVPARTCVGCRECAVKSDLLRLVVREGVIVPDPRGRLPGRGAYLHPDPGCHERAVRRRAFRRAFRSAGPLDTSALDAYIAGRGDEPDSR